jgi:hypothetical protein
MDEKYKRVAQTALPDGKWVSTVWLGLNHAWNGGPPLIFETMVFTSLSDFTEIETRRYSTEAGCCRTQGNVQIYSSP